jgi:NAD(P)-dependent dehydrogenase (short-subunit alcohol dehydrogenase family)
MLSNKVTGNSGLDKKTVLQLAAHHSSHIYLAARTASEAPAAIDDIKTVVPNVSITYLPLDLSSFDSIATAARTFNSVSSRLDVLINNVGIMAVPPTTTTEGYGIQFGTNHMGHALLTHLLLPTLLVTAKLPGASVRIINLSSEGHNMAPSSSGVAIDQTLGLATGTLSSPTFSTPMHLPDNTLKSLASLYIQG